MSSIKITGLVENYVSKAGLIGEHGFSVLVDAYGKRILFDTGQGKCLENNMRELNVPPDSIDAVVLSHGHYDHTCGLKYIVDLRPEIPVYGHPALWKNKYKKVGSGYIEIGVPDKMLREKVNFVDTRYAVELAKNITVSGQVSKVANRINNKGLLVRNAENKYVPDLFEDEVFLIVESDKGLVIMSGCCHLGLKNVVEYARVLIPNKKIAAYVGGLHLKNETPERIQETGDYIESNIERVYTGHCTGIDAYAELKAKLKGRISYFSTGSILEF